MRILIISLPRTGSTSFAKKLAEQYGLSLVFEPFAPNAKLLNIFKNFESDYTKDNVVVKTLVNDMHDVDWLVNFSKEFDEVYLLSRRNLKECIESWAYLNYKRSEIGFDFETEYYWERTPNYEEYENQILKWNEKLKEVSKELNKSIIYYEDIFDSTKNRLRKGDKKFNKKII
jgi:hypothetical protein